MIEHLRLVMTVIGLIVVSGIGDSFGFLHSSRVWHDGRLAWTEVAKSAAGFIVGMTVYWFSIPYFQRLGVTFAETQTLIWFGCTITGVAILSGKFLHWTAGDQAVAVMVLAGVGWLMHRAA